MALRDKIRSWLGIVDTVSPTERPHMRISRTALRGLQLSGQTPTNPFELPTLPPFLKASGKRFAKDSASPAALYAWASQGLFSEGLGFLGYTYLAELFQRPEYRRVAEIWASESTRKWVKLKGQNQERIDLIEAEMVKFGVREKFREAAEIDSGFGRSHIFIDTGDRNVGDPLIVTKETVSVGSLKNLKVVEPLWCYPLSYNATNPLSDDFYAPKQWQIMGTTVHNTRLLSFVGRELPDILKPAYMFGGLSMLQMIKPYVDNYLRARQSVSDLISNFSTMILMTNMGEVVTGGGSEALEARAEVYTSLHTNDGLFVGDKDSEEIKNVAVPLGTLDKLQAQAQEQISSAAGIPLIVLLKVTPTGLNVSSEGELRAFYAEIRGYQERVLRTPLMTVLNLLQLNLDGVIDDTMGFDFIDLWEPDAEALARIRKSDAEIDEGLIAGGVVSPDEARERNAKDEQSPFYGIIAPGTPAPEAPDDAEELAALSKPNNEI
jgi:uncharacterized protein